MGIPDPGTRNWQKDGEAPSPGSAERLSRLRAEPDRGRSLRIEQAPASCQPLLPGRVSWTPHSVYRAQLLDRLARLCGWLTMAKRLWQYRRQALILWCADLDAVAHVVLGSYRGTGRPPRDPAAMLRTWLLATLLCITSPRRWAEALKSDDLLAILSGFAPGDTPGASTLRDFLRRLTRQMRRRSRCHRPHRKRGKGPGQGKKQPLRRPDMLWRLQTELPRFVRGDEGPLQEMLAAIAHGSAARGLIDLQHLRLAGDSTAVAARVDTFGRRTCSCPQGSPCTHPRRFTDGDADWGWDSAPGVFFFGHRFYEITAAGGDHDLPLYLRAVGADRHDAVSWLLSYADFASYYRDAHVDRVILDAAHDAGAIFDRLERDGVQAIIDLNPSHHPKVPRRLAPDGRPICACGAPMVSDGSSRGRLKFVCPRRRKRNASEEPACRHAVYISGGDAFRLHPGLPRGSEAWRLAYNDRTCTERSHARKLNDFGQAACRRRSRPTRAAHYFLAAYAQHFSAWADASGLRAENVFRSVLEPHLRALQSPARARSA
jgi:hypothetical protein